MHLAHFTRRKEAAKLHGTTLLLDKTLHTPLHATAFLSNSAPLIRGVKGSRENERRKSAKRAARRFLKKHTGPTSSLPKAVSAQVKLKFSTRADLRGKNLAPLRHQRLYRERPPLRALMMCIECNKISHPLGSPQHTPWVCIICCSRSQDRLFWLACECDAPGVRLCSDIHMCMRWKRVWCVAECVHTKLALLIHSPAALIACDRNLACDIKWVSQELILTGAQLLLKAKRR
jgi:hypothetical protein